MKKRKSNLGYKQTKSKFLIKHSFAGKEKSDLFIPLKSSPQGGIDYYMLIKRDGHKYFPPNSKAPYGFKPALLWPIKDTSGGDLLIVESPFEAAYLCSMGIQSVALGGANLKRAAEQILTEMKNRKKVVIALDPDQADSVVDKALETSKDIHVIFLPADPDEVPIQEIKNHIKESKFSLELALESCNNLRDVELKILTKIIIGKETPGEIEELLLLICSKVSCGKTETRKSIKKYIRNQEKAGSGPTKNEDPDGKFRSINVAKQLMGDRQLKSHQNILYEFCDKGYWKRVSDAEEKRRIIKLLCVEYSKQRVEEVWFYILHMSHDDRGFDDNPYLLNLKNGMYDVRSGKLFKHDSKYRSTIQLPVEYVPDASPILWNTLDSIFGEDADCQEKIECLLEMLAYCLYPVAFMHVAFIFYGQGSNGKGVIQKLFEHILGAENVSNLPLSVLRRNFGLDNLLGKLANFCSEVDSQDLLGDGLFKQLVAGDRITVDRKNQGHLTFTAHKR